MTDQIKKIIKDAERAIAEETGQSIELEMKPYNPSLDNINTIADIVCESLNVTIEQIKSSSRRKTVVHARHILVWYARIYTSMSLKEIGTWCGDRDHTTAINSKKRIKEWLDCNDDMTVNAIYKVTNEIARRNEIHTRRELIPA
jgi:chromosomal replication initiation ATPase DnaA